MKTALLALSIIAACAFSVAQEPKASKSPAKGFESGLAALTSGASEKISEGLQQVRTSADSGYAPAQTAMGSIYFEGRFVTRDPQQAISWYKKAGWWPTLRNNP